MDKTKAERGWPVWAHVVLALVVLALIQAFVVRQYRVPSSSMEPTLATGDRILVNRWQGTAERGAVIVFTKSDQWPGAERRPTGLVAAGKWLLAVVGIGPGVDVALVKRVVGVAGDTVACCDGTGAVLVNGNPLDETYLSNNPAFTPGALDCSSTPRSARCFGPVTVPAGRVFVLGDNRANSADSLQQCRSPGSDQTACAVFASADRIVGRVGIRLWPLGRAGTLPTQGG